MNSTKGGSKGSSSSETTYTEKVRPTKGKDGSTSKHIIETDARGKIVSKTHQVTDVEGKVIHQHQDFVPQNRPSGETAKMRQFPDEWSKYPKIDKK